MTSRYVFHEWWMRNWEAKALNIIYGNTSQPFLRPHAKPFLCLPPVTQSINIGCGGKNVQLKDCETRKARRQGAKKEELCILLKYYRYVHICMHAPLFLMLTCTNMHNTIRFPQHGYLVYPYFKITRLSIHITAEMSAVAHITMPIC